jgi:hypothetical protein
VRSRHDPPPHSASSLNPGNMSTVKSQNEFETRHTENASVDDLGDRQPYVTELIHLHDIEPRGPAMRRWERARHSHVRWFVECLAEAVRPPYSRAYWSVLTNTRMQTGTFMYSYAGGAAGAAYIVGNLAGVPGLGCQSSRSMYHSTTLMSPTALFQVGAAYTIGIVLALVICSATSGGHINPCITITMMIFHKFPVARGLRYAHHDLI